MPGKVWHCFGFHFLIAIFVASFFSRQRRRIKKMWENVLPLGCSEARMPFITWTFLVQIERGCGYVLNDYLWND